MKELSPADRPREKLLQHGAVSLGDNELVALLLAHGVRGADALQVANGLLGLVGGLHGLARSSCSELARVSGVGVARATQVLAAIELGRRAVGISPADRPQLRAPRDAAVYLLPAFGSRPVEHFGIVLLDARYRVIRTSVIASGTQNTTIVQPRDVFREALLGGATAIIAFHNHPSGDPSPSDDDHELTRRLAAAGILMGVELVDHVVLGDARYCSFKETGRL